MIDEHIPNGRRAQANLRGVPMKHYDLLREGIFVFVVVAIATIVLAALYGSPDYPTITAQSGAVIKQNTRIAVSGCGVRILSHRVHGHMLILKLRTLGGGKLKLAGKGLHGTSRRYATSTTATFRLPLSGTSLQALRRHPRSVLHLAVHVGFTPAKAGAQRSGDVASVTFNKPHPKRHHKR